MYNETSPIIKFELMDGAPVKGESMVWFEMDDEKRWIHSSSIVSWRIWSNAHLQRRSQQIHTPIFFEFSVGRWRRQKIFQTARYDSETIAYTTLEIFLWRKEPKKKKKVTNVDEMKNVKDKEINQPTDSPHSNNKE